MSDRPKNLIQKSDKPQLRIVTQGEAIQKDLGPLGNQDAAAIQTNAFEPEDEYQQLYVGATRDQGIIAPPFAFRQLDRISLENDALQPCIEAMITNIDGTGYSFESKDEAAEDDGDDTQIEALKDFFGQPWPGMSFTSIRKLLRRDLHRTGNAFLEVLRTPAGEIAFFRHVDAKMMRMLRLDEAVPVAQKVVRGGNPVSMVVMTRERRFCQLVNGVTLMYFKEFGASRDLHKKTAVWANPGQKLPAQQRATEILHLIDIPDSNTPYGIPRWIPQLPSVLGSRKAEEFNLDFFVNGGIPPVLILLQGGSLQAEARAALQKMTTGQAAKTNRVQVMEIDANSGNLDQTARMNIIVERFGGDRQKDSMFEDYDAKCEVRVRRAFRLPPIFVGAATDYSFASAFTSYVVAEAQVFRPERDEFDEMISLKLLPAMGYEDYVLRSKPLVIEDATLKLQGLEIAIGLQNQLEPSDIIDAVNEICSLHLKVSDAAPTLKDTMDQAQADKENQLQVMHAGIQAQAKNTMDEKGNVTPINPKPTGPPPPTKNGAPNLNDSAPGKVKGTKTKSPLGSGSSTGTSLAGGAKSIAKKADAPNGYAVALDMLTCARKNDWVGLDHNLEFVRGLDPEGQANFKRMLAEMSFVDASPDTVGLGELAGCTLDLLKDARDYGGRFTPGDKAAPPRLLRDANKSHSGQGGRAVTEEPALARLLPVPA